MQTVTNIIAVVGFASIVAGLIYIGRKLQILDDLRRTHDTTKFNIKVISDFLTKNFSDFNNTEIKNYSPNTLTTDGLKFIKSIGFAEIFAEHKRDFFDFIDGESPKFKYDVETAAIKSVFAFLDHDFMAFLKIYFYNNPVRNLSNTAPTLGIYVRDHYLAEHPEIIQ